MKRTLFLIENGVVSNNKITCVVVGEMIDGVKVWENVENGQYYFLTRISGKCYFYKG